MIVDNFAGGGGASAGIEAALGRPVDLAINHDPIAIEMHRRNHPDTEHLVQDIWSVDPTEATRGEPVEMAWFSPDCRHFSRAKGGKPKRDKAVRDLAWVVIRWAAKVRPRVIFLENVVEFQTWGPLDAKGVPIKSRKGETFEQWLANLRGLGYEVDCRELVACDYGAPTSRKRFFLVARCDGEPICWPEPTHGDGLFLEPYRTAAECIDWSLPCPSIFTRKRPLAENTLRRIAAGIDRYVLRAKQPFIVTCNHGGSGFRGQGVSEPFKTITASRDAHGLVAPYFVPRYGERPTQPPRTRAVDRPLPTIVGIGNQASLVAAYLQKNYGGPNGHFAVGQDLREPAPGITARDSNSLTCGLLEVMRRNAHGRDARRPAPTIVAGGKHLAAVQAFLLKYYGTGTGQACDAPLGTITARDRFAVVEIAGAHYVISDIGMRMLQPRELFLAQGFPATYWIDGLTKTEQVRLCGNSVPPHMAKALVCANLPLARRARGAA